jgi:hydroxypyruvate isomerase
MKHSACIELLYPDRPFLERIRSAAEAGFDCIEFWLWEPKDLHGIQEVLRETGLEVGIFQGNIEGRMTDLGDKEIYIAGVKRSIAAAQELGAKFLFLMTDILQADRTVLEAPVPIPDDRKQDAVRGVLHALKPVAEAAGITLVIEPLNGIVDHKGYFLQHSAPAFELVEEVDSPNIKVLYDVYHLQIMEGNIIQTIRAHIGSIGYVHIADVPGRHEPGTGELNCRNILKTLESLGYGGIVGFEFEPSGDTDRVVEQLFRAIE